MSAKDQIKQIVDYFKREPQLKDKTDGMAEGLMLGADLADEANERSMEAKNTAIAIQEKYKEQILTQDLNPNKDPELVDLRNGFDTAGERINDLQLHTNEQLNKTANDVVSLFHKTIGYTTLEFEGAEEGEDNADAFDRAVASFGGKPGKIIFSGVKTYKFFRSVFVPANLSLDYNLGKINPVEGGEYIKNHIFIVNADNNGNTVTSWGGEYVATITGGRFENPDMVEGIKAFYSRSKTNFENHTFKSFWGGYYKDGKSDEDYSDMIKLKNLYFINCEGTDPLINIRYNGDGLMIDSCHVAGATDKNHNLLYLYACNGGKLTRSINGDINILGSSALSIEALHCEQGKINIVNSTFSIKDVFHMYNNTFQKIPLTIKNSQYVIENYVIAYVQDSVRSGTGLQKNYTAADSIDAFIDEKSSGEIRNFFRRYYSAISTGLGMKTAAKISTNGTSINYNWEANSQLFSKASTQIGDKFHTPLKGLRFDKNFVTASVAITDHGFFDEVPGLYYYRAVPYFGPSDRKIGRFGGNEVMAAITGKRDYPLINIQEDPELQYSRIRLYRGKSPGSYTHYVDIPVGAGLAVYDSGFYVSTGERWRARGWSGQEDAYNMFFTKIELRGENVTVYGDRLPNQGKWTQGDVDVISNVQGDQEFVCAKSGDFSGTAPVFRQRMWV